MLEIDYHRLLVVALIVCMLVCRIMALKASYMASLQGCYVVL